MKYDPLRIVLVAFLPLFIRSGLYFLACKVRSIQISLMSCIVIAGSGVLLTIVPIPLPYAFSRLLAIGLAMFLMTRYTEAELFPDVVLIPLAVEVLSGVLTELSLLPFAS